MLRSSLLNCAGKSLDLTVPLVMGVLNVTPDSFSDGGQWSDTDSAIHHGFSMIGNGADIIDVGGESTRPGAPVISVNEELKRIIPVIEALAVGSEAVISVDTGKPEVMQAAIEAGAGMINDVFALRQPGALEGAAMLDVPVCLMHMQGEPGNMQKNPEYHDVVTEVESFLLERASRCQFAGIEKSRILLDPGFGFGKTQEHNTRLFAGLKRLAKHGFPILAGLSRKSMLGRITGKTVEKRLAASLTAAVLAIQNGASIVRVHDVEETVDALKVMAALGQTGSAGSRIPV